MSQPQFKKVFIFIDTDKHASPFDILATIDALPEATIMKYENVTAEDADKILYDAMFPRGPEGAKHTKVFINGRDFDLANEILDRAKKCMFPPFELSVIIDPRGAYTTASAAVAISFLIGIPLLTRILKREHNDKHEYTLKQVLSWFEGKLMAILKCSRFQL